MMRGAEALMREGGEPVPEPRIQNLWPWRWIGWDIWWWRVSRGSDGRGCGGGREVVVVDGLKYCKRDIHVEDDSVEDVEVEA